MQRRRRRRRRREGMAVESGPLFSGDARFYHEGPVLPERKEHEELVPKKANQNMQIKMLKNKKKQAAKKNLQKPGQPHRPSKGSFDAYKNTNMKKMRTKRRKD